jgi:hypothetical protein
MIVLANLTQIVVAIIVVAAIILIVRAVRKP